MEDVHTIFHFFSGCIPHTISNELFLHSCNIIVSSLVLLLFQLSTFTHNMRYRFTFLVTHSTKCCFIYLVFHIVCSNCLLLRSTQDFCFNFQVTFSQLVTCFFSICSFWHFSYKLSMHMSIVITIIIIIVVVVVIIIIIIIIISFLKLTFA